MKSRGACSCRRDGGSGKRSIGRSETSCGSSRRWGSWRGRQISLGVIDMKAAIATDAGEQPATVGADARQCGAERIGRGIEHQLRLTKRELPGIETTAIDIVAHGSSEAYLILIFRRKDTKKSPLYQIQGEIFEECNKKGLYLTN